MRLAERVGEKRKRRGKELTDSLRNQKRKKRRRRWRRKVGLLLVYTPDFESDCSQIHIHYPEAPELHPAGKEGSPPMAGTQRRTSWVGDEEEEEEEEEEGTG